jgi:hypothetical protein
MKRHRLTALGEDQTGVVGVAHLAARHGSTLKIGNFRPSLWARFEQLLPRGTR